MPGLRPLVSPDRQCPQRPLSAREPARGRRHSRYHAAAARLIKCEVSRKPQSRDREPAIRPAPVRHFRPRHPADPIAPGLHLVATPIGNLGDVTIRALATLAAADLVYCEDTRMSRRLLDRYAIKVPVKAYHEHNAQRLRPVILDQLRTGARLALISDAGMPLISDPGYKLVRECDRGGAGGACRAGPVGAADGASPVGAADRPLHLCRLPAQPLRRPAAPCSPASPGTARR
jgi:hypothetical protein